MATLIRLTPCDHPEEKRLVNLDYVVEILPLSKPPGCSLYFSFENDRAPGFEGTNVLDVQETLDQIQALARIG
ncbi:MAG: hypothetical protein KJ887_07275 [Candidatus Omnitrophica bacterium]|nr:hypothetical protein [Candidatus Omnitrophota bacterium]